MGFEPTRQFDPPTRFPVVHLKPLGHLSSGLTSLASVPDSGWPLLVALPSETGVAVVGAGFGGLGMAIRLRLAGREDFVLLERAEDVGGTWWANTYPG